MNETLEIRAMASQDAEAVAALTGQLGYSRSAEETRRCILEIASTPAQAALVASIGETVVGWIEVSIERRLQSEAYALIGGLVVGMGRVAAALGGNFARPQRIGRGGKAWRSCASPRGARARMRTASICATAT